MIVKTAFDLIKKIRFSKYNEDNVEMGYGYLIVHERPNDQGKVGIIEDVLVYPEFRRQGVASAIIKEIQAEARRRGLYKICLFCSDENIKLYSQHGFRIDQNQMRWNING